MLQIFDCTAVIGQSLPSHDASVTLSVSPLRWADIHLYPLPPKTITSPQREAVPGRVQVEMMCVIPVEANYLFFCTLDFRH